MRNCRKCKLNKVAESRKYCNDCKIKVKLCRCGQNFKSKIHQFCKLCRNSQGNDGICDVCQKARHIYYGSGVCTTCYKFITKYKITKQKLIELRKINYCQLCGTSVIHNMINHKEQAVIDHDHHTGKVRGILCVRCNIIEGMIRNQKHLDAFYKNYQSWITKDNE